MLSLRTKKITVTAECFQWKCAIGRKCGTLSLRMRNEFAVKSLRVHADSFVRLYPFQLFWFRHCYNALHKGKEAQDTACPNSKVCVCYEYIGTRKKEKLVKDILSNEQSPYLIAKTHLDYYNQGETYLLATISPQLRNHHMVFLCHKKLAHSCRQGRLLKIPRIKDKVYKPLFIIQFYQQTWPRATQ